MKNAHMHINKAAGQGCGTVATARCRATAPPARIPQGSQLAQWPCQIRLVPVDAPYFDGASLLIAADCAAYAYAGFHSDFMKNHITLIGCPKLDAQDWTEKLSTILASNRIKSLTVVRMEVACCGGMEHAVRRALLASGSQIPCHVITISTDGKILDRGAQDLTSLHTS